MKTPIVRIKSTDVLGNVAYIVRRENGAVSCILANGMNAALSYAGIHDEMACKFRIEDCSREGMGWTVTEFKNVVLDIVKQYGSPRYAYEVFK